MNIEDDIKIISFKVEAIKNKLNGTWTENVDSEIKIINEDALSSFIKMIEDINKNK